MLSAERVKKFQTLYKKRFGKEIDENEALEKGAKLLRLMQLVYKPMTRAQFDAVEERRKELSHDDQLGSTNKQPTP